jgi:dihydroorotate dehydrogenase (fumarate)
MAQSGTIHHRDPLAKEFAASLAVFPTPGDYAFTPDEYMNHVRRVKAVVDIPVIASLNGTTTASWLRQAISIQQAGADALELNMYQVVTDLDASGIAIETWLRDLVAEMKRMLRIPIAVKLAPFFTAFGNVARHLDEAGADGLVIFNRFYQPDIDLDQMEVVPNLMLSTPAELRLVLRWIAILHGRIEGSLAATTGVDGAEEAAKLVLAGADVTMMASSLLRHGPQRLGETVEGLRTWLEERGYESLEQAKGSFSQAAVADPSKFERANYMRTLMSYSPEW